MHTSLIPFIVEKKPEDPDLTFIAKFIDLSKNDQVDVKRSDM